MNQLFEESYCVYRKDRSSSNSIQNIGGGVVLAVRYCFKSRLVSPPDKSSVEQLWVAVTTADATLFICVIYIPPDRINDAELINSHLAALNWVVSQLGPWDKIIILGDVNLSTINWQRHKSGFLFPIASRSLIGQTSRLLLDAYSTAALNQMNDVENENSRILDLVFVSNELRESCLTPSPLVKIIRHHPPVQMQLKIKPLHSIRE